MMLLAYFELQLCVQEHQDLGGGEKGCGSLNLKQMGPWQLRPVTDWQEGEA